MVYFTRLDYRDRKKRAKIIAKQVAHCHNDRQVCSLQECWKIDDPSVNRRLVFQDGGIQDKATGNFVVRFVSLLESTET